METCTINIQLVWVATYQDIRLFLQYSNQGQWLQYYNSLQRGSLYIEVDA